MSKKFQWREFFRDYNIPFTTVETGRNVSSGWLGLRCPWCGDADESDHMGVPEDGAGYHCWRSTSHKGRNPTNLIQALLKVDVRTAGQIASQYTEKSSLQSYDSVLAGLLKEEEKPKKLNEKLEMPKEFREIKYLASATKPFFRYLCHTRKFQGDTYQVCKQYDLRAALEGLFRWRIIFPVRDLDGTLVTWQGRHLANAASRARYLGLSTKESKRNKQNGAVAKYPTSDCVFPCHLVNQSGHTLLICEGPFDAIKMDFYGKEHGVRAVCLFGQQCSNRQASILQKIAPHYEKTLLLLDSSADISAVQMISNKLFSRGIQFAPSLPRKTDDPGSMRPDETKKYIKEKIL